MVSWVRIKSEFLKTDFQPREFPFDDSIERGKRSGVSYVAEPGGSIRDQLSIDAANKYGMVMAFTGLRLFHH